jgi:hypothetical protein
VNRGHYLLIWFWLEHISKMVRKLNSWSYAEMSKKNKTFWIFAANVSEPGSCWRLKVDGQVLKHVFASSRKIWLKKIWCKEANCLPYRNSVFNASGSVLLQPGGFVGHWTSCQFDNPNYITHNWELVKLFSEYIKLFSWCNDTRDHYQIKYLSDPQCIYDPGNN